MKVIWEEEITRGPSGKVELWGTTMGTWQVGLWKDMCCLFITLSGEDIWVKAWKR